MKSNMKRKDFIGYRIFLGILLALLIGVAIWYGFLTFGDDVDLKDATLVRGNQEWVG